MPSSPRRVVATPLTAAGFAPFGQVVEAPSVPGRRVNLGTAVRHDRVAAAASSRASAEPNVALFRCDPQALPLRVTLLERHPHSTQLFASLAGGDWLVVVVPGAAGGEPDLAGARAFRCPAGAGVNLGPGVWHHPVVALGEAADLLMLAWEDGGPGDCEERRLADPFEVVAGA